MFFVWRKEFPHPIARCNVGWCTSGSRRDQKSWNEQVWTAHMITLGIVGPRNAFFPTHCHYKWVQPLPSCQISNFQNFYQQNHENHQINVQKSKRNHQKPMGNQWKPIWNSLTRLSFFFRRRIDCFFNGTFTTARRDPSCIPANKFRVKNLNIFYYFQSFFEKICIFYDNLQIFQKMLEK